MVISLNFLRKFFYFNLEQNDYIEHIVQIMQKYEWIYNSINPVSDEWVEKFSDENFKKNFVEIYFNNQ